jgi:hypothetical protein
MGAIIKTAHVMNRMATGAGTVTFKRIMRFGMTFSTIRDISMLTVMTAGASHICMGTRIGKLLCLGGMTLIAVGFNFRNSNTCHGCMGIGMALETFPHRVFFSMRGSMTRGTCRHPLFPCE